MTDTLESNQHPMERLSAAAMSNILVRALSDKQIAADDTSTVFYDISRLKSSLAQIRNIFPSRTLHAIAVKANPLLQVLRVIRDAGCGLEVASIGEMHLALSAGFRGESIVFDSPVKTIAEIRDALTLGCSINANSLAEVLRIGDLRSSTPSTSNIGIRINPEIGRGTIESTSVAVAQSKFGVSLSQSHEALAQTFIDHDWISGLHVHIGSQGMSLEQLIDGVGAVYDLSQALKAIRPLQFFNVGGGLPAQYRSSETPPNYAHYAKALRQRCPDLFNTDISLVTEFGRSIHAGCGWVASRIEYVVEEPGKVPTLYVHVGADMFLRKAYRPDDWHHDLSVCDASGHLRDNECREYRVAGPLCFAGDYISRSVQLPAGVMQGDILLVHDAGAYTFSMWSVYNSRQFPRIIGYEESTATFKTLKNRQSLEEIQDFWSDQ